MPTGPSALGLSGVSPWAARAVNGPGETRDLSGEKPELLKELQEAWNHYAEEVGVIPAE